jgi:hypothetical protein
VLKAVDFINKGTISEQCKYKLHGNDEFLKWYIVDIIADRAGLPKKYIATTTDLSSLGGLFSTGYLAVVSPECKFNGINPFMVKLTKSSITADRAIRNVDKNGVVHISCFSLFPNEIESLVLHMVNYAGLDRSLVSNLINSNYGDLSRIDNQIKLLQLNDFRSVESEEDYEADSFKVINYFLDKNYQKVLELINSPSFEIAEFTWTFAYFLEKMYSIRGKADKLPWYDTRLRLADQSLKVVTLSDIIRYVSVMTSNYISNASLLRLKFNKLLYSLIVGVKLIG